MSELLELYAIFVVLYLFECVAWVPRRAWGFFSLAVGWRGHPALRPNASWSRAAIVGTPWPPLSPAFIAEPAPFAMGPDGIAPSDPGGAFKPWNEAGPFEPDGDRLMAHGSPLVTLATRRGTAALARTLEAVRTSPPARRGALLERWLDARFDADTVRRRMAAFGKDVRLLRVVANALWVSIFVGLAIVFALRAPLIFLPLGGLIFVLWMTTAVVFVRTLARLDWLPRAEWPERSKRLVAILSPMSAMRATDLLARELVGDLDPLAVAAALVAPPRLAALARPRLAALRLQRVSPPPGAEADERWWRTQMLARVERVLRARGLDPDGLMTAPPRESNVVQRWCPSCLAQYGAGPPDEDTCRNDECASIPLLRYGDGSPP